ncbi:MAG: nucleotidyltransferase family protein, partial [Gemmatimonadota bacterium]|nr:nucleotidyltransferase family protein [Gemmatimonadota bacterium]
PHVANATRIVRVAPAPSSQTRALGRSPALADRACWALRLALGGGSDFGGVADWAGLLNFAVHERCAALAWLRSGDLIRAHAPAAVADRWRAVFLSVSTRGHAQIAISASLAGRLAAAGIGAITLKGAPLAARLYGDPTARASTDIDWYIPAADRIAAGEVLVASGWSHAEGASPGDETYVTSTPHGLMYLEVHSSLLHPRFAYLRLPEPASERVDICGTVLSAHSGDLVPAYFAAHLATHTLPPLLWDVDFLTLWNSLDEPARASAMRAADRAGLGRYLRWAFRRTLLVRRGAGGDLAALSALGFAGERRTDAHPMWRHIWLAPSARQAWNALGGWLFPPWVASEHGGLVRGTARRVARHWRAALGVKSAPPLTARPVPLDQPAALVPVARLDAPVLLEVAKEVIAAGGEIWIEVTGHSMQPTIRPGDRVLLGAPGVVRPGHVVLADAGGRPLLHRVRGVGARSVVLRADASRTDDPEIVRARVVARALVVARGDAMCALTASPRFGTRALARYAASRARLVRARVALRKAAAAHA